VICWLKQTRWTLVGIVLAGLVTDARALDPNRLPEQYVREQWTTETGFPGGSVNGIAQTADGYLWIATDRGLIRFDGFNFRPVSFTPVAAGSNVPVLQLLTDAGGTLWIRPLGAYLLRQKDRKFESIRYGLPAVTALSKDNHGGVLVSDVEQGTFRFTADDVQKLGPSSPPVISMAETADGKVWLGTLGDGLFFLAGGRATSVNAGLPDRKINSLLPIGDELWVGTDTGLFRGNDSGFRRVELPSFAGGVHVLSILRDHDSNMWLGTTRGLLRVNSKGISFSEENELRGDGGINVLFEDREGNLWIGGARGLGRIRDSAFLTYSSVGDYRFERNGPVYVDREGRTWFAPAQGGLYVLQNGRVQPVPSIPRNEVVYSISGGADEVWAGRQRGGLTRLQFRNGAIRSQSYTEANGLAQNSAYAVYESRDGSVWAGTLNRGVSKFKDGRFTTYTTTSGLASNTVSSILETRDGAMWFATPTGLSSFSNGSFSSGQWRTYTTVEGLPSPEVNCLFEDSSGTLWSGTSAGLAFFASGRFQVPNESPDVLREPILGMAEDRSGRFWIATSHHVLRVPRDKLPGGVVKAVDVHEYDQADGLGSTDGVKRSRSVVSDSAGRIWFSLSTGLSVVNPSQIAENSVPALPHIEAITADGNAASLAGVVQIPPFPRRITFEYTGLSLAVPGRIRFRYFLEGFDSGWSQPVAAREAVYTNLGPGSYRFRLVASNSEGLWNGPETAIVLRVAPAYYQTYWFRLSCVAILIALLWALYRRRVHQLTGQEKHLRDVVETIPAMTFTALSDGSCTFVNKRWTEYTGLSIENTSGAGWQRAIDPEDLVRHSEKWRISVTTGQLFEDEARFRRAADGEYRWFLVRGVPLRDQHENIVRWYGTLTDIEDRKRAEEALQQSRFYLVEGQRLAQMGSWAFNPSGFFEYWSQELFKIYGLDPQKGAPTLEQYLATLHPQDRESMAETIKTMLAERTGCDVKKRIVRPDGEQRYIRCVGIPIVEGEVLKGFLGTAIDVTEQELLTHESVRRQAYLAEAQRLTHTGSWTIDVRTDEHFWSEEIFRIYEFDAKLKPAWSLIRDRVHPDDRASLDQRRRLEFTQTGWTDSEADLRIVLPDGRIKHLRTIAHPVRDATGRLVEVIGTTMDVTERKRVEDSLRRSESHLAEAQRLTHTGSWVWNVGTDERFWSEETFRIFEADPAEVKPSWSLIFDRVHPDDRAILEQRKEMESTRTDWAESEVDFRIVVPGGKIKHLHYIAHPVRDASGQIIEVIGTTMDVTERKRIEDSLRRSESYLAEAQRLTHTGSWAWRVSDRRTVHLSGEFYRIYGFDPAQGGPTWEEYSERVHPEDRLKWRGEVERVIAEKANYDHAFRILLPNGKVKWIRTVGHPVLSDAGDLEQFVGSSTDITEVKSAEQEREKLRQLEADLAHIDRVSTLGEMAASLAHEIKQPLAAAITSANSCIEWLAHEPPNLDRARAAAARIDKYGNRAAEIIDRIRSFYKKSLPQRELVDVNGIIEEMLTLLKGEATRFSVDMCTDLSAGLPEIMVDRVQLQQVFMNLMLNSIEAMMESGGELTVKSKQQDGQLQFSVSDTGVGLPMEKTDQIFSAFFTTKPQGSGMGLAISRSIVESHGGRLWASTNSGGGATFHFTLPIQTTESSP
jgi:PAS domain S-box-containing protein